ncbi:uncharacterized protein [Halyomorpha halys]|uniref:uncharacterized protein n=1 Tax=Halyomorpha halys TaxID=286706 RepID=UPI0006D5252B
MRLLTTGAPQGYLKDIYKHIARQEDEIIRHLSPKGVEWKFIPPRAPHFGGNWETGVKSAKSLLAGVMGPQPLTFEELATAFIRIKGVLNSRPLTPMNEDPENFDVLTPAHFLIGTSLAALPEASDELSPRRAIDRWDRLQAHLKSIWNRWSRDYLHTLQQKGKWIKRQPNLKKGDLVIMVENRTIIGHWPVARISDTHAGKDGVVRTVTVKTPSGKTYVRPVVALAPLFPLDPESESFS